MFTTSISELAASDQFFICTTCRAVVNVIAEMFRSEDGEFSGPNGQANSQKIVVELCIRFKLHSPDVCSGRVGLNWPILYYIVMNSLADARSFCGTLPIPFCHAKQTNFDWSVKVDNTTGPLKAPKSEVPKKTDNDLTIVHLTDIHYDPEYQTGSVADCEEHMCCRATSKGTSNETKAGYWSDYRDCDSPLHMVENALDHIMKTNKKIHFVYQTGDIVPHNIWSTTKEGNKVILTAINDLIANKFPNIPVYPCVGNHEPHPTNV